MKRLATTLFLMILSAGALAGSVPLTWKAPTACADGTALSNCPITGYVVEQAATDAGPYAAVGNVAGNVLAYTVPNLAPGPYSFRVRSVSGTLQSDPSASIATDVEVVAPGKPTDLAVTK